MPVVNTLQDSCISYDPNHRIIRQYNPWAIICVCKASGLAKLFMPGVLREKDNMEESDRACCFAGRSLVWSYILPAWGTPLEVVNSPI